MGTFRFSKFIYLLSTNSKYDDRDVVEVPSNQNITCPLCLYLYNDPVMLARCSHTFCRSCINKWFCHLRSCPLCRKTGSFDDIKDPPKELSDAMNSLMFRCKSCDEHKPLSEIELHEAKCYISKHGRIYEENNQEKVPEQTTSEENVPEQTASEESVTEQAIIEEDGSELDIATSTNDEDIGDDEDSDRHYPGHTLILSPRVGLFNGYYTNGFFSCASAIENELVDQIVSQSSARIMESWQWYSIFGGEAEFGSRVKAFWKHMASEIVIAQTDFNDCLGPIHQNEAIVRMKSAENLIKRIARKLKRLIIRRGRHIHFRFEYQRHPEERLLEIFGTFTCFMNFW